MCDADRHREITIEGRITRRGSCRLGNYFLEDAKNEQIAFINTPFADAVNRSIFVHASLCYAMIRPVVGVEFRNPSLNLLYIQLYSPLGQQHNYNNKGNKSIIIRNN